MRLFSACALWLATVTMTSADTVNFGLAKDSEWSSSEHIELMQLHGLTGHATVYYTLMSKENLANPFDWVRDNYLEAGIDTTVTLIIDDRNGSTVGTSEGTDVSAGVPGLLQRVIDEEFDVALRTLAQRARAAGTPVVFRPFHEIDGGWYQWGMYATGNSCELAADAVNHVIDIFEEEGANNVSWEINVNRRDGRAEVFGAAECFIPRVEGRIDAWSVSTYNRCLTNPDRYPDERSFSQDFRPIYDRIAALSKHPINVAEVSTSGLCAPRLQWFEQMLSDLERFPRTERVTFFFGTVPIGKASNTVPIYWGFNQDLEQLPAFRELILSYQEAAMTPATRPVQRPDQKVRAAGQPVQAPVVSRPVIPKSPVTLEPTITPPTTELSFGRSWEYAGWLNLSHTIGDEPIPGYGQAGLVARGNVRFSYLPESGSVRSGPYGLIGGVASNNCDQRYWDCLVQAEVGYSFTFNNRDGWPYGNDYNSFRFDIGVGHKRYWNGSGRPSRLDNGDTYGQVNLTWTFGGTLSRK